MSEPDKTNELRPRIRLTRAAVHDEFVQIDVTPDPGSTKKKKSSRCKHCPQVLSGVNPTNLRDHLKAFHGSVYQKVNGNLCHSSNSVSIQYF